jgi:hypothetical protein
VEDDRILSYEWDPTGGLLAVSLLQKMLLYDVTNATPLRTITYSEIDKECFHHGATQYLWRPDGKSLACVITFLGGRLVGPMGSSSLPGDRELFVIPLEGGPHRIHLGQPGQPVSWYLERAQTNREPKRKPMYGK